VAYIALNVARQMGMTKDDLIDVFYAAALHDVGLVRTENKLAAAAGFFERVTWHPEVGSRLLAGYGPFEKAADIVRYHHMSWRHGQGAEVKGHRVPFASHVIALADRVALSIDPDEPVLDQRKPVTTALTRMAGAELHPDCVDAFRAASRAESFWLDCVSERLYSIVLDRVDWRSPVIDERSVRPVAKIFARVVDAGSSWTAAHTAGVSSTAAALAARMNFSPREVDLMRSAGYLHDIGKLTVPSLILDKHGKLTTEEWSVMKAHTYHTYRILTTIGGMPQISEWAAFHHERLDGNGYPFHQKDDDLTLGSRIMAVADVLTAVTEDRPYREGMGRADALVVLKELVRNGGLDVDVVATAEQDFDDLCQVREEEQAAYTKGQRKMVELIKAGQHRKVLKTAAVSHK